MPAGSKLQRLLSPRSVALIGASERDGNRAGAAAAYLRKFGFAGAVHIVHPSGAGVAGYDAVTDIAQLPDGIDVAVVGLGAASAAETVRQLGRRGVASAIVWAGGFAEGGEEGAQRQRELVAAARESGVRVLGPNCLGVVNTAARFTGTFATWLRGPDQLRTSGISMVSQSGGLAASAHSWSEAAGVGFRFMISTGNEADVGIVEVLRYLVDDPGTHVIQAYLEGITDGTGLIEALRAARAAGKTVVVLKVGHSAASAAAIAAHTGALSGETRVWDAVLRAEGAIQVHSVEQMLEVASYLQSREGLPPLAGGRLAIVGHGGGAGVLAADQAGLAGLEVPRLGPATREALAATLPEIASVSNPIDCTPEAYIRPQWRALLPDMLRVIEESGECDAVLSQLQVGELIHPDEIAKHVIDLHRRGRVAVAVYNRYADSQAVQLYRNAGLHVFADQGVAVETLALLSQRTSSGEQARPELQELLTRASAQRVSLRRPTLPTLPPVTEGRAVLAEAAVHELLASAGFDVVRAETAHSAAESAAIAERLGYPVVMKVLSQKITHRAKNGLVRLGLTDADAVAATYDALVARTRELGGDVEGVLVEQMITDGAELLVSGFRDPVFGPVVSCGAGGVATELIDDVSFACAPLDEPAALRLLGRLRTATKAYGEDLDRGGDRAVAFLVDFSRLLAELPWRRFVLELNPVRVAPDRAVAVDGLLIIEDSEAASGTGQTA
jgi:acetate---CoA ligase (ADP-forming)